MASTSKTSKPATQTVSTATASDKVYIARAKFWANVVLGAMAIAAIIAIKCCS